MGIKPTRKPTTRLMSIKQGVNEMLIDYTRRFNEEIVMIVDYIEQSIIYMMLNELYHEGFK